MSETVVTESTEALSERVLAATIGLFDLAGSTSGSGSVSTERCRRCDRDQRRVGGPCRHRRALRARVARAPGGDRSARRRRRDRRGEERRYALPPGQSRRWSMPTAPAISPRWLARRSACCARCRSSWTPSAPARASPTRTTARTPGRASRSSTGRCSSTISARLVPGDRGRARPARRRHRGAVADVGCGTGWSSIAIARAYPHVCVEGIDSDRDSIEAARANAARRGSRRSRPLLRPRRPRPAARRRLRRRDDLRGAARHGPPGGSARERAAGARRRAAR